MLPFIRGFFSLSSGVGIQKADWKITHNLRAILFFSET